MYLFPVDSSEMMNSLTQSIWIDKSTIFDFVLSESLLPILDLRGQRHPLNYIMSKSALSVTFQWQPEVFRQDCYWRIIATSHHHYVQISVSAHFLMTERFLPTRHKLSPYLKIRATYICVLVDIYQPPFKRLTPPVERVAFCNCCYLISRPLWGRQWRFWVYLPRSYWRTISVCQRSCSWP